MNNKKLKKLYTGEKYGKYRKNILDIIQKFQGEPKKSKPQEQPQPMPMPPVEAQPSPLMGGQGMPIQEQGSPMPMPQGPGIANPKEILQGLREMMGDK